MMFRVSVLPSSRRRKSVLSRRQKQKEKKPENKNPKKSSIPSHLAEALIEYAASLRHVATDATVLLLGTGTIGRGMGLGTVLLAGLEAKKSAELIVGGGALVVVVVDEAAPLLAATLAGGLEMMV